MSRYFELIRNLDSTWGSPTYPAHPNDAHTAALRELENKIGGGTLQALRGLVGKAFLKDQRLRCVLFAGATPGVGCTWIVVHSAEVLSAETHASVCVAEVGTRSNWISEYFQAVNDAPPAGVNGNSLHSRIRNVGDNLWFLPGSDAESAGLLSSHQQLQTSLRALRQDFEYVLLDMSSATRDCTTMAGTVDAAVLVLKAGHTSRIAVKRAVYDLDNTGIKIVGTVLNQHDYSIPVFSLQ